MAAGVLKGSKVYRVEVEVHGYLVFSSAVMPAVRSSRGGPVPLGALVVSNTYIHNYPLIYALGGRAAESYAVIPSMHVSSYERGGKGAGLSYSYVREMLNWILLDREPWFYVFPLEPVEVKTQLILLSSESWSYALPVRSPTKNVFPRLVNYVAIAPGSRFETIVVSKGISWGVERYVRIGKKRWGAMRLRFEELEREELELSGSGGARPERRLSPMINLGDAEVLGIKLDRFVKVLETPSKPINRPDASIIGYGYSKYYVVFKDRRGRAYYVPSF